MVATPAYTVLLKTKTHIPPRGKLVVDRTRLTDALNENVPLHKISLIAAPAGYGKTTLLAEWGRGANLQNAWLTLDEGESDPENFLRYLFLAWQSVQPQIAESELGVLLSGSELQVDAILTAFVNEAADRENDFVFVLDDYHLVQGAEIHEALTFLLDHLPGNFHFVVSTRSDPPLPLARFMAKGQFWSLNAADLNFSLEESSRFFRLFSGTDLDKENMANLYAQLEGWAAGMQFAAISFQRDPEWRCQFDLAKHRHIAEYFGQEVLSGLLPQRKQFLLDTSILESFNASLCETVARTGNAAKILDDLEREHFFITPLDAAHEWFRYHVLFADYLRQELARGNPERLIELHSRAAGWYAEQDMPDQAFRHAIAADDPQSAIRVAERHLVVRMLRGEVRTVQRWLDMVPQKWVEDHVSFAIARASLYLFQGQFEQGVQLLEDLAAKLTTQSNRFASQLGQAMSLRCAAACMQGDLASAEQNAERSLHYLREEDVVFRISVYLALGDSYRRFSFWRKARDSYREALGLARRDPLLKFAEVHAYGALADLDLRLGSLREAGKNWDKAESALESPNTWGGVPLPLAGWVLIRKAEILYESDDLAKARALLQRGMQRAELGGDARTLLAGYLLAARIDLAEGELDKAAEDIELARPYVQETPYSEWTARFHRQQVELWLAENRPRPAMIWALEILKRGTFEKRPESELAQLAVARALLWGGGSDQIPRLSSLLEKIGESAGSDGKTGILIEAKAISALLRWKNRDMPGALVELDTALHLAEPEGYRRLFADLGLPMRKFLQEADSRGINPEYVQELLDAFRVKPKDSDLDAVVPDLLTHREREVLRLLIAGLTNREIGDKLVISPETVKKHTGNIYGKLGVKNRMEAAETSRKLKIIS